MIVLYAYAGKPVPEARDQVIELDGYYPVRTDLTSYGYCRAVREVWGKDDLLIVEGDKVLPRGMVGQLALCSYGWCTVPVLPSGTADYLLCHSIGIMKWAAGIQMPFGGDFVTAREMDGWLRTHTLQTAWVDHPHVHGPPGRHLHGAADVPQARLDELWENLWTPDGDLVCRGYTEHVSDREG